MKIYTKTGDAGETSLFSGERKKKSEDRIEAYGNVDELNSFLGFAIVLCQAPKLKEKLLTVQNDLFLIGSDLATPLDSSLKIKRISEDKSVTMESWIDQLDADLEPLKNFILPGGGELSARLHICRTLARRAERGVVRLGTNEQINAEVIRYLNRLSDFFFVAARWANHEEGQSDVIWNQDE